MNPPVPAQDASVEFRAFLEAIVAAAQKDKSFDLASSMHALLRGIAPPEGPGSDPKRISQRGIRSAAASFYLKLGNPPAGLIERSGVADAPHADASRGMAGAIATAVFAGGTDIPDDAMARRYARACGQLLTELYAVAATEWHNATVDEDPGPARKNCHVVAQVASLDVAFAMMAGRHLSTPCGLASVVSGLAQVPAERRTAAAAEMIRWLNIYQDGEDTHADLDSLAALAVSIYG